MPMLPPPIIGVPGQRPLRTKWPEKDGHDSLHIGRNRAPLTNCWCMCPRCFLRMGHTRGKGKNEGTPMGKCICPDCPCRQGRVT